MNYDLCFYVTGLSWWWHAKVPKYIDNMMTFKVFEAVVPSLRLFVWKTEFFFTTEKIWNHLDIVFSPSSGLAHPLAAVLFVHRPSTKTCNTFWLYVVLCRTFRILSSQYKTFMYISYMVLVYKTRCTCNICMKKYSTCCTFSITS